MDDDLKAQLQHHFGAELTLEGEIGRGDMSRVFLATQPALGRRVVVKILSPKRLGGLSLERFRREIMVTAKLQHPHIVPILMAGSLDTSPYYVMPFVEGESLRARLERDGRMSVKATLDVLRDVAEALEYAHANGVVHRDIKPDNVLLSGRNAVVTDFGVAKALAVSTVDPEETLTWRGTTLGTPAYMAPEQAAADPVFDHRVDLYALGVVAYELLTGATPFAARTLAGTLAAHIVEQPRPIDALRDDLPPLLAELVMTCLSKEPDARPPSANAVLAILDRVPRTSADESPAVGAAVGDEASSSIAVLPFKNLSGDRESDYLSDGITEAILNTLARVPTLRVAARTSAFAFKGRDVDAREIGRKLRVTKLLSGSVRKSGQRVRVLGELTNAEDGFQLWAGQFEGEWKDIFDIEDEISLGITTALASALSVANADTLTRAGRRPPRDVVAYELYLKGRFFLNQRIEGMWKAMQSYELALERDPTFALGHAGVAEAHFLLTLYSGVTPAEGAPRARDAALRALSLDPGIADAHVVLANVSLWYDWDHREALNQLDRAIALKPSDSLALSCYAYYFASLGRSDEAIARARRAIEIDPLSLWVQSNLAVTLYLSQRYREAIDRCHAILELAPSYSEAYRWMALSHFGLREWTQAEAMVEKAVALSGRNHWALANLGAMLARANRRAEAQAILDELMERSKREAVPPLAIATVHYGMGDLDSVFEWLERAYVARDFWLIMLEQDPGFTDLRQDPRFGALLERVMSKRG